MVSYNAPGCFPRSCRTSGALLLSPSIGCIFPARENQFHARTTRQTSILVLVALVPFRPVPEFPCESSFDKAAPTTQGKDQFLHQVQFISTRRQEIQQTAMASLFSPLKSVEKSSLLSASVVPSWSKKCSSGSFDSKRGNFRVLNAYANGAIRSSSASSPVISAGLLVPEAAKCPQWSIISEEISVGPFPRSPDELDVLVRNTGINAFILLETDDGVNQIGLDWEDFRKRVNQQGAVAVRLSMKQNDRRDQVLALPETVRAIAALITLGYKVHVSCTNGIHRSPLVALGYLTMMKGLTLTEAWKTITAANPYAKPDIGVLREVQEKKFGKDAFSRGVATDVSLSDAVSKAASTKATRIAFEQLADYKAKTEAASQTANSAKDRLEFFARQIQSLKEKEEAARKATAMAIREKETLNRRIQLLSSTEKSAVHPAVSSPPAVKAEPVSAPSTAQIKTLNGREASLNKELSKAESALSAIHAKVKGIESSIADAVSEDRIKFFKRQLEALKPKESQAAELVSSLKAQLRDLGSQTLSLESPVQSPAPQAQSVAGSAAANDQPLKLNSELSVTKEKLEFLGRRLELQKEKHEKESQKAEEKITAFSAQVLELKAKLASADALASQKEQKLVSLSQQIEEYHKREKKAAEASLTQNDKLQFLNRHIESLRKKEESARQAAKSATEMAKLLEQKVNTLANREAAEAAKINELNHKVATLVQLNAEQGVELKETKEREAELLQVLEDGTGVLTKALESDKAIKKLKQEVADAMLKYEQERVRADLLQADLERELISSGKKTPKHYNDIEKVPNSDLEKQLLSQLATTKQTLVASGSAVGLAVEQDSSSSQLLLRDVIFGALSMAAVPFTLMSIFSDGEPLNMSEMFSVPKNESAQVLAPVEVVPPKPIVVQTSADDFCKKTLSGERSARVERFCSSLAEIALD